MNAYLSGHLPALASAAAFVLLAPVVGCLVAGIDRKLTARLQSRVGPPLLQPLYDVQKLLEKKGTAVSPFQAVFIWGFLVFTVVSGAIFFAGGDLLIAVFALAVGGVCLVLAAFTPNSPYSVIGAERELLQMMAYEPMVILAVLGFYLVTGTFDVGVIASGRTPAGEPLLWHGHAILWPLLPILAGFLYILTIKFRKSPFDLSTSHHGHQELVKGLTTEFSGRDLALVEIAHWYENVLLLGMVWLFFANFHWAVGVVAAAAAYLLEIWVDNANARLRWQFTVKSSWVVALACALALLAVEFVNKVSA